MDVEAIVAGIGAVVTGAIGITLTLRELRSRERKSARAEMAQLIDDIYGIDEAYIAQRHYSFELRQMVADNGDLPPAPPVYRLKRPQLKPAPKPKAP